MLLFLLYLYMAYCFVIIDYCIFLLVLYTAKSPAKLVWCIISFKVKHLLHLLHIKLNVLVRAVRYFTWSLTSACLLSKQKILLTAFVETPNLKYINKPHPWPSLIKNGSFVRCWSCTWIRYLANTYFWDILLFFRGPTSVAKAFQKVRSIIENPERQFMVLACKYQSSSSWLLIFKMNSMRRFIESKSEK